MYRLMWLNVRFHLTNPMCYHQELPREALYMPPLSLRVVDHRAFGSKPVVATAVVSALQRYTVEPKAARWVHEHKAMMVKYS